MIDPQAFKKSLKGKPVALFGMGKSGLATMKWLKESGIDMMVWDDRIRAHRDFIDQDANVVQLDTETLSKCACLILAPGVPLTHPEPHPVVKAANEAGCEIIGDVEILHRCRHGHKTIAITGTNGKSTTTALLTHVLNACGKTAVMGGNIGVPALAMNPPAEDTIFVLEISSYQIDLSPTFKPDIGIVLNVTPDHIDRHGSFENYAAIKEKLIQRSKRKIRGANTKKIETTLGTHEFPTLPGDHNKQNILAVLDVCKMLDIDEQQAIEAVKTFPGLVHRQYLAREIDNVRYINDSKATNAEATSKALGCHENIYWIVGGQAKDGGLDGLGKFSKSIKHAYLIGESVPEFEKWMETRHINYTVAETLRSAVPLAHKAAQSCNENATVLLSPACASFDQFKSFERRGDKFIELVDELQGCPQEEMLGDIGE